MSKPPPKPRSNAHPDPQTDARFVALEIKLSFQDDLLDHLNQQVAQQQQHIDLLLREVASMRRQQDPGDGREGGFRSLRDELPPHY